MDLMDLIIFIRIEKKCNDPIIIYTGYNKEEISEEIIHNLKTMIPGNLIIKWGRFKPNQTPHYDPVLGVNLASDNQYGELIK